MRWIAGWVWGSAQQSQDLKSNRIQRNREDEEEKEKKKKK